MDHYVDRLQVGKSLGLWNTGIFLLADNQNAFLRGQGIVRGLYAGAQSQLEPLRAVDLTPQHNRAQDALIHFRNPAHEKFSADDHPLGQIFQKIATPLTTQEVSVLINLPRREVPGVRLRPRADFGINPPSVENGIELGRVIYQGGLLEQSFAVTPKSLTQHIFITGITGAGKTNTCLTLLRQAHARNVPFLVIEPAKTEYRALLADSELGQTFQVFTLGAEAIAPFRLNPFEFMRGFNLLTHIDFLKAVFNASFPMYASMPYILEEAVLEVYTDRGWDIASSENRFVDARHADFAPYLPTLSDLYNKIETVVLRKKYAAQLTMDITAALKARLQSLLNGGKGLMLDTQRSIPIATWLERPTVLELRYVGDDDEKAFLIALILVLIYEHNQVRAERATDHADICHLTLIEEAHRLLKNMPTSVAMESANPRGKAVEMFTDILAEIREYGEGFVIVDQIPSKLTPDVVKNTNLKILHRLVADDDRRFVGNAMGLTDQQREHIVRLKPGEAVVHCAGLERATLIQVTAAKDDLKTRFKEQIGVDGLKARMLEARRANRDAYRRWIGCQFCDAPCEYLSDANRPDPFARAQFAPLFNALLYGDLAACQKNWEIAQAALRQHLLARSGQSELAQGEWLCHLVQLTRAQIDGWCDYFSAHLPAAGIGVELHTRVSEIVRAIAAADWSCTLEQIAGARNILWNRLALEPRQAKPGCALCQRHCRFGFLAQQSQPLDAKVFDQQIKAWSANPANRNNYALFVRMIKQIVAHTIILPIAADELSHLGFCYLANYTARLDVLAGYQRNCAAGG
ncbi:MAG: ATP-binding protein [Chloroflexi bacterium]|nr:ATP-binding protein [Chloroflexota bacterium]